MEFQHYSYALSDPRCASLCALCGYKGYGIYWGLIERLLKSPDYSLPYSEIGSIASDFHVRSKLVRKIVDSFDLFEKCDNGTRFRSNPRGLHTFPKK